jgi:hypothetical protein
MCWKVRSSAVERFFAKLTKKRLKRGVAADRSELEAVVANRNSSQKHVWRVRIVLGSFKLLDCRLKPTRAKFRKAEVHVPDAAEGIARA